MDAIKLLIVDDHTGITSIIRKTATGLGYTCHTVNDPERVLKEFLAFQPSIVILDMMMPEKDGLDVLDELVKTDVKATFILSSGYGDGFLKLGEKIVRRSRDEAVLFLKKPFRHQDLVRIINEAAATARG